LIILLNLVIITKEEKPYSSGDRGQEFLQIPRKGIYYGKGSFDAPFAVMGFFQIKGGSS
jgi:hypothetical protein